MGSGKSLLCKALHNPPSVIFFEGFYCFSKMNVPYWEHIKGLKNKNKLQNFIKSRKVFGYFQYLLFLRFKASNHKLIKFTDIENTLKVIFPNANIIGDAANLYYENIRISLYQTNINHIVIYRDCRDVVAEMKKRLINKRYIHHKRNLSDQEVISLIEKTANRWEKMIKTMDMHKNLISIVRYEDLVINPDNELSKLTNWLGLERNQYQSQFMDPTHIGEYKKYLSKIDMNYVMNISGSTLEKMGYV
jgi:hypothetical protein